jgi:hypothetical protein
MKIRLEAGGPAEPVGVGDVGEERRPDQVDAGADLARAGAAVAAGGRVPALVEGGRGDRQDEHDQQGRRIPQELAEPEGELVRRQEPPVHGGDAGDDRQHGGPAEQRAQQCRDNVGAGLGEQRAPGPQGQQRAGGGRGGGRTGAGDEAEGQQLGGDDIAHLVGAEGPAEVDAGQFRNRGRAAGAVHQGGYQVQQPRHLDDLPVGPTDEERRRAVAGVLVLAKQLDPRGQPGSLGNRRRGRHH